MINATFCLTTPIPMHMHQPGSFSFVPFVTHTTSPHSLSININTQHYLTPNIQSIPKLHHPLPMIQLGRKIQCRTPRLSSQFGLQQTLNAPRPIHTKVHFAPGQIKLGTYRNLRFERHGRAFDGGYKADARRCHGTLVRKAEHALPGIVCGSEVRGWFTRRTGRRSSGGNGILFLPVIVHIRKGILGSITTHHIAIGTNVHAFPAHGQSRRY
mmetsp:Transcript_13652/g.23239  ORF Transcript_13652/g.23239 Transcript_13652/m.23239 type:complete len:212 (+) Transcript_13652:240-875(+)